MSSQVILKPVVPHTEKEQVEYSVAAERRRVRMLHDDIIKDLLSHGSVLQGRLDKHHSIQKNTLRVAVPLIEILQWV